jgi:hypothetical protein
MGRLYAVSIVAQAVSVAVDLFEIAPADDRPVALHALSIGQTSDVGDAAEELLGITIVRGHTTSGSGGSASTPAPLAPNDAAAGFVAETLNTTLASAGTAVTLHADVWNVRAGYQYIWTPETRPVATQANGTIIVRHTAPADSLTLSATLLIEELA